MWCSFPVPVPCWESPLEMLLPISQPILFAGPFNTVKCLVKSSPIRRTTTSFVTQTASSAYLCVVFTDSFSRFNLHCSVFVLLSSAQ